MSNIPYNPVIHDLQVQPRPLNAEEIVAVLFDMYENINLGLFASFLPHIEGTKQSQWPLGCPFVKPSPCLRCSAPSQVSCYHPHISSMISSQQSAFTVLLPWKNDYLPTKSSPSTVHTPQGYLATSWPWFSTHPLWTNWSRSFLSSSTNWYLFRFWSYLFNVHKCDNHTCVCYLHSV